MKNETQILCPVCGSDQVEIKEANSTIQAPYGPNIAFEDNVSHCKSCGSDVDYSRAIDSSDKHALEKSLKVSIETMIESLAKEGFSLAYTERALDLPQRTISRWKKSGDLSSIGVALLRIVKTYPWILKVAENKFDPRFAIKSVVENGVKEILNSFSGNAAASLNQVGFIKERTPTSPSGQINFTIWENGELNLPPSLADNKDIYITTTKMAEV